VAEYFWYDGWVNVANENFPDVDCFSGDYAEVGCISFEEFGSKSFKILINNKEIGVAGSGTSMVDVLLAYLEGEFVEDGEVQEDECTVIMNDIFF